ncbi:hypothetical protein VCRA2114E365_120139 [Vibrio crassostreae]|nr:hypothetical protein VCRA2114O367_120006 [Vibrio crassostreae]CAK1727220.1 hypothetical protein VCRA2113O354_120006 [Vibrio crassostreae]CAK1727268.1 hypothetical protein VCRA2113O357_120006 [Vibrio crassostreae]CAK1728000.1 hypothetical protein VCRA2117O378_120006 [Vibrio crassostreae]CAK1728123.1 hypothetical protein VCRA2113O362_120006 [Vibrio crassostreae]
MANESNGQLEPRGIELFYIHGVSTVCFVILGGFPILAVDLCVLDV